MSKVGQPRAPVLNEITNCLLFISPPLRHGQVFDQPARDYIFYGRCGNKLTRNGAYQIVRRYLQKIGFNGGKLGPHVLRHTLGRHWLMNGGDLKSLMEQLGHSDIKTTEKYASLVMSDIKEKHTKYSPLSKIELEI